MNRAGHELREDLLRDHVGRYSPPLIAWVGTWAEAIELHRSDRSGVKVKTPGGGEAPAAKIVECFDLSHYLHTSGTVAP